MMMNWVGAFIAVFEQWSKSVYWAVEGAIGHRVSAKRSSQVSSPMAALFRSSPLRFCSLVLLFGFVRGL